MFPERNDEGNPEKRAGDTTEREDDRIESIAVSQQEYCRHRKHHAGRCPVYAAGNGLHDVVLDDAAPAQDATQDAEAEYGRQLRPLDRKAEYQGCVADRDGDDDAEKPADTNGNPGQLGIRFVGVRRDGRVSQYDSPLSFLFCGKDYHSGSSRAASWFLSSTS